MAEEEAQALRARRRRRWWVKPWLQRRQMLDDYDNLMQELMRECDGDFKAYMRMSPDMFRELVDRVSPRITKFDE